MIPPSHRSAVTVDIEAVVLAVSVDIHQVLVSRHVLYQEFVTAKFAPVVSHARHNSP